MSNDHILPGVFPKWEGSPQKPYEGVISLQQNLPIPTTLVPHY